MKTAVSLPNEVFEAAEEYARRTQKSRSELYAQAIAEYLARHVPDRVTESMNDVMDRLGRPDSDAFARSAARAALERSEW
jgi:hypothetical protein